MSEHDPSRRSAGARTCPVCSAPIAPDTPAATRFRPFCSSACADVDLLRWLRGGYVIPSAGADDDEDGDAGRSGPEPGRGEDPAR